MPAGMVRPRASQAPRAADVPPAPAGVWLLATATLGRTAPAGQAYPHICGRIAYPRPGGPEIRLRVRDCAACGIERETEDH